MSSNARSFGRRLAIAGAALLLAACGGSDKVAGPGGGDTPRSELPAALAGTYQMWDLTDADEGEEEQDIPENAISGVFGLTSGNTSHLCYTTGGTITITTSTSTRLAGSLNVTATCYHATTAVPTNITLTGQFSGVGGQVD